MTFDEYLRTHLGRLNGFAAVLVGDRPLAEDVLQTVLARAYEQWDRVSAAGSPHAYVRRMITNEYLSWQRKWRRVIPVADLDDLLPAEPDSSEGHAARVALLALVRELPSRQRAVVVLRYYEGLGDDEIADVLGCGASTVRSNATRALAALRVSGAESLREELR